MTSNLGKEIEIIGGGTPKTTESSYWDGDIDWLSVVDFSGSSRWVSFAEKKITNEGLQNSSTKLLEPGDIIVSARGTVGEIAQLEKAMAFNQSCYGIRAKKNLDQDFLYYLLKQKIRELQSQAHGGVFNTITRETFDRIKIQYPDKDKQKKIAKILGDLDRKIELNRRMSETLKQIGQALFKKHFVDNPESEGWEKKSLDEIAEFKNGLACQKYPPSKNKKGLRVIKIREMSSGFTDSSDTVGADFPEDYIIKNGDLLFAWSGTLMTKIWTEGKGALNQHIFKVTSEKYPKWFYYHWVDEHLKRFKMIAKSKAVTMGHIKRSHLSEVDVKVPPKEFFDIYDGSLSILLEKRTEVMIENNTLIDLRDSLLPKLISGQIKL